MNHQPFETWLLSKEPLSPEQAKTLQSHLTDCLSCRRLSASWSEVEQLLRAVPPAQPAPNFALRWQTRLAAREVEERIREQRRQSWWTLVICAGGAAGLLGALTLQVLTTGTLPDLLLVAAHQVMAVFSFAQTMQGILATLTRTLWSVTPPFYGLAFLAAIPMLSALWIVSLRKILLPLEVKQ